MPLDPARKRRESKGKYGFSAAAYASASFFSQISKKLNVVTPHGPKFLQEMRVVCPLFRFQALLAKKSMICQRLLLFFHDFPSL
jgi:hypothetical protein